MRNRLIFVLAIVMSLGLAGCGQDSSTTTAADQTKVSATDTTTATDQTTPPVVATTDDAAKSATTTASSTPAVTPPAQANPSDLANSGVALPPSPTSIPATPAATTTPPPASAVPTTTAPVVNTGTDNKVAIAPAVSPVTGAPVAKESMLPATADAIGKQPKESMLPPAPTGTPSNNMQPPTVSMQPPVITVKNATNAGVSDKVVSTPVPVVNKPGTDSIVTTDTKPSTDATSIDTDNNDDLSGNTPVEQD